MKEVTEYREQALVITDEEPFHYQEGTWICHEARGEWQVLVSRGGRLLYTPEGSARLMSKEAAITEAHRLIDLDLLELDAHTIGLRLPTANTESPSSAPVQNQIVPKRIYTWPDAKFPVQFVLELHNATPVGSNIRKQFTELITEIAKMDAKAHWARAIRVLESGDLAFDDSAYSKAVHRGKQETYASSAMDLLEKLQQDLLSIRINEAEEKSHPLVEGARFLLPEADQSAKVRVLKENWSSLVQVHEGLTGEAAVSKSTETIRRIAEVRSAVAQLKRPA